MNCTGDELLSGSALPQDQNIAAGIRYFSYDLKYLLYLLAFPDNVLKSGESFEFPTQEEVLGTEAPLLKGIPDDELDLIDLERFGDVIIRPFFKSFDGGFRGCKGG